MINQKNLILTESQANFIYELLLPMIRICEQSPDFKTGYLNLDLEVQEDIYHIEVYITCGEFTIGLMDDYWLYVQYSPDNIEMCKYTDELDFEHMALQYMSERQKVGNVFTPTIFEDQKENIYLNLIKTHE